MTYDALVHCFSSKGVLPDVRWRELSVEQQQRCCWAIRSGHVSVKHADKPSSLWGVFFFHSFRLSLLSSFICRALTCSFDALVLRFEAPDSRNRWDSPLFTILKDDELPFEAIFDALFNRKAPPANQSTQSVSDVVISAFFVVLKISRHVLMWLNRACSNHCRLSTFYTSWTRLPRTC